MSKNKIFIDGLGISNLNFGQILEKIEKYLEKVKRRKSKDENEDIKPLVIFTPNSEMVVYAQKDAKFKKIVNSAQINIPDGQGVVWASKVLGQPLGQRITGIDLAEKLTELAAKKGLTIGLIGGGPQIAVKAAECLKNRYPGLKTVVFENVLVNHRGEESPEVKVLRYDDIKRKKEVILRSRSLKILMLQYLNIASLDILLVGFGVPKQEYFINKTASWLHGSMADKRPLILMAVGGALDYFSGRLPRAPQWVQNRGLEWFYRLAHQPWRIKRQLALLKFILLVVKQKLGSYRW